MIVGAFLGIFFIPLFFVLIRRIFTRRKRVVEGQPEAIGEGREAGA